MGSPAGEQGGPTNSPRGCKPLRAQQGAPEGKWEALSAGFRRLLIYPPYPLQGAPLGRGQDAGTGCAAARQSPQSSRVFVIIPQAATDGTERRIKVTQKEKMYMEDDPETAVKNENVTPP